MNSRALALSARRIVLLAQNVGGVWELHAIVDMASEANVTVVSPNIVMSKATSTTRRIFRTDQNVWACSRQVRTAPTERARFASVVEGGKRGDRS